VPDAPGERALAEALVQGALGQVGDRPPDDVTTVDDLFRWSYLCSLLQSAPGKLSPEEITYVLSSAAAADWLRRPGALETTLARLDRENVEPAALESVLASLLASDDALRVELADPLSVMAVDAFVYTPQTGASDRRALERLLGVVHPNGIQALLPVMLATATEALAGEDAVGVDMETMAPLVVANGGRLSTDQHRRWLEHPEVRDLLGAGWNPLSETAVGDALTASGDVQPLVAALARFPDRVAELVDAAVNDGRMDDEELVALWRRLPPPCLPDLTGVLLRCPGLHKDVLLYRLLDDPRLEESSPLHVTVLVPLLQRYWRELAAAARFPAAVSAALAPVWPRTDAVAGENGSGGEDPGYPPDNGDHDESVATTGWRSWRRGRGRHPT
jgi:hypothetical protein